MNWRGIWAIYKFEMHRFRRTLWTGLAVPVITTSLYFIVFGTLMVLTVLTVWVSRVDLGAMNTAVAMTAPPAMLYAIPVEKWMTLEDANQLNLTFLLVVAIWRVALWIRYLRVGCGLGGWKVFLCATLPLVFIFGALVISAFVTPSVSGMSWGALTGAFHSGGVGVRANEARRGRGRGAGRRGRRARAGARPRTSAPAPRNCLPPAAGRGRDRRPPARAAPVRGRCCGRP